MTDQSPQTERLRKAIMVNPRRALDYQLRIIEDAEDAGTGGAALIEVRILTAETYQRLGLSEPALRLADTAVAAAAMPAMSHQLVLAAATVHADTALVAGKPDPVDACQRYAATVHRLPGTDERRVVMAAAMHAVAVYHHHDCAGGRELLHGLLTSGSQHGDSLAGMLAGALTAMQAGCRGEQHRVAAGYPPPVPGAALQPDIDAGGDYLAARVRSRVGAHAACGAVATRRDAPTMP